MLLFLVATALFLSAVLIFRSIERFLENSNDPFMAKGCAIFLLAISAMFSSLYLTDYGLIRRCRDGWISKSIGYSGACSWHGGVVITLNSFGWWLAIISSIIITMIIACYFSRRGKK